MKKVLMIPPPFHPVPPMKGAAVETWINEISRRIIGYEMHIASIGNRYIPRNFFENGVYYHRIVFSSLYRRLFQKILGWDMYSYNDRLIDIIKKVKPDIIHLHNYRDAGKIIDWTKKQHQDIKIIYHMHNKFKKIESNIEKSDCFVTCSQFLFDQYAGEYDLHSRMTNVLYNGVDTELFFDAAGKREYIRNRLAVQKINICYYGRISSEKGVDKFVEIAKILKDDSRFMFYCFGEIPERGGRRIYFEELNEYIDSNRLKNIVFFDSVSPDKIRFAYQLADAVVVPSKFEEPFGMVAIEAMAAGIPLIAASKGGMKEYLENNVNAVVINDYDNFAEYAAQTIADLFADDGCSTAQTMIEEGRKTVTSRFDWHIIAAETEKLYYEVDQNIL